MASAPLLGLRFLCALALMAVAPALVWDVVQRADFVGPASTAADRQEWGMLGWVVACAAVAVFARFQAGPVPWRPARLAAVLATYLPFAVVWVGLVIAYLTAVRACGGVVPPQDFLGYLARADVARPGFWLVVIGVTVAAPVAEEIAFRGYLQGAMLCLLPRWPAIAVVAVVFGLVHTLPYALPISLLGGLFGWLATRHGSLLPAILAHALHNTLTVVVTVVWPETLDLLYPR